MKKKHYNKIVETLKDLIRSLKKDYNALNAEEKLSEEGQTLRRVFVNLEHFDDTIMP